MQKLIAMGYRRIGFVMHRGWDHAVDHLWTAGFLCEQQTVASTFQRMLLDLEVGNDLRWLPGGAAGITLLVPDMAMSGA